MTLSIRTNQLKSRKHVEIDGHPYTVRRMGNIESMDLTQYMRRLQSLADIEKATPLTDAQLREVDDISRNLSDMFVRLFDDGGDQSKSRELVASLGEDEIYELLVQIFESPAQDEKDGAKKVS